MSFFKQFNTEHSLNKQRRLTLVHLLVTLILGFVLGYSAQQRLPAIKVHAVEKNIPGVGERGTNIFLTSRHLTALEDTFTLQMLSEHAFSCNAEKAFEELTSLHKRAKDLEEHNRNGEANLSRKGTIARKSNAASAAEIAFRECAGTMMPELLSLWDAKLKRGEIDRSWGDDAEKRINGITFKTLEETADSLD